VNEPAIAGIAILLFIVGYAIGRRVGFRAGRRSALDPAEYREWRDMLEPHCQKFELAAKFGAEVTYNSTGSASMAKVLRHVAEKIDLAVDIIQERRR
jgi:hypothetical protein